MVDWESTSGFNQEAQRMQTATAATRTKKSASHFDMLREDDSEQLNVMDFVETEYRTDRTNRDRTKYKPNRTNRDSTEYKPDKLRGRTEYGSDRTNRGKTEYKPDRTTRGGKNARKSSQRKPLLKNSLRVKSSQDPQSVLVSTVQYNNNKVYKPNKTKQHRHAQRNSKIQSTKLNSTEVSQCYPYAACLKTLCDQAGSSVQNSAYNLLPEKLFDTLKTVNVHYPYSSLLEELHQNANLEPNHHHQHQHTPSSMEELHTHESRPFEIASVMRNINVPMRGSDSCINLGVSGVDSYAAPYSGMLMAMVMQQQIQEYANNQHRQQEPTKFESCRVGEILRAQMPVVDKLDSPPHELQSSAILQKLAFSAQEEEVNVTRGKNVSKKRSGELPVVLDWSSTESSQCEEDDSEWRPPHWQAKKVTSIDNNTTSKRKTRRKTKRKKDSGGGGVVPLFTHPSASQDYIPSECITDVQTNYSRPYTHVESESSVCVSATKSSSQLLQLIVGCDGKDTTRSSSSRKNRKIFKRSKPTKRKGKQQRVVRKRQKDTDIPCWQSSVCDEQITPESTTKQKHTIELECMNEPQSLLKEYLLKPTEEILPVKNCDVPKANTSFLFSRLLQNFKNLAESGKPSMITKKEREDRENQSILRGMLVAGNSSGGSSAAELLSKSKLLSQTIRDDEIADDVGFPRTIIDNPFNPHTSLYDTKSNACRVKCEDDIKVECEDIFCKVECEEEVFECQVCYLQFSSGLDLSNHKILFHCSADDPLDTNTDTEGMGKQQMVVVPCGGDGDGGGMEEEGVGRVSVESSRR